MKLSKEQGPEGLPWRGWGALEEEFRAALAKWSRQAPTEWARLAPSPSALGRLEELWGGEPEVPDFAAALASGGRVGVWADPHFGEGSERMLSERGFGSSEAMDAALEANFASGSAEFRWCATVGDLASRGEKGWELRLRELSGGRHILLAGNRDLRFKAAAMAPFSAFEISGFGAARKAALCHWPIGADFLPQDWLLVHGHTHRKARWPGCACASVEATGLGLKDLQVLLEEAAASRR